MLLTISTTADPADELGYLLHKNPARTQSFELPVGRAHVFYPEVTSRRCTAARLRQRGLGHKRSLAQREYALGLESLDRLAGGEPLWRVHECVFAVLALESEPVDPRL